MRGWHKSLFCLLTLSALYFGCSSTATTNTAPTITRQPAGEVVAAGQMATFSIQATGMAPLSYQWQKNGVPIGGATSTSYTTPPAASTDDGAMFRVVVSNSAGSVTSGPAQLTVDIPPSIVTQPANQSVHTGSAATFAVVAAGTQPLGYQWQKNGVSIDGATSPSYTTPPAVASDNGTSYRVTVTNVVGTVTSTSVTLTVSNAAPVIVTQPSSQTVDAGQAATFSVVAAGTPPLSYQWQRNGEDIGGATAASYTTPPTVASDNGSAFRVTVSNSAGRVTSDAATLTVRAPNSANVLTYHNDNARTGQNLSETVLNPTNVDPARFGKVNFLATDGLVDAQPLYVSGLTISGAAHNVLYVATEHDTVYAFDADSGLQLWQVSVLGAGEITSDSRNCSQVTPEIGITSTPVIDLQAGRHGMIFLVAMSKDGSGRYHQRLHVLDVTDGAEEPGSPVEIQATYPGSAPPVSGGRVIFDPAQYKERAALLLLNGVIYTAWASHCDIAPYTGWIIGYDESSLAQASVLNLTPNGSDGAIWQAGGGLAADSAGNIYALVGNGTFDTTLDAGGFPSLGDFGNTFIKISTNNSRLEVADYFTMWNTVSESAADQDLGSGGPMLLPELSDSSGRTRRLAVGAGKDGNIYVVDRDFLGKFIPGGSNNSNAYQVLDHAVAGGVFAVPAYYNGTVYYGDVQGTLKAFPVSAALLSSQPASQSMESFGYPGVFPGISADGATEGIVWVVENSNPAVLHAFAASNLGNELYNSNQASNGRDHFGPGNKFITPTIANGKVYVGTPNGVAVFGLLAP